MKLLAIDTSTQTMGVALFKGNNIVAEMSLVNRNDHTTHLMTAIQHLMQGADMAPDELDEIIATNGPGSYTGTRIGVTTAKTLGWSLGIPVQTVSSLKLIAYQGQHFDGWICPFIDARRGRVYTGLYRFRNGTIQMLKDDTNVSFKDWLSGITIKNEPILFLSQDTALHRDTIETECVHAKFPASTILRPSPSHLFSLKEENAAYNVHPIVPNYLRKTEAETNLSKKTER